MGFVVGGFGPQGEVRVCGIGWQNENRYDLPAVASGSAAGGLNWTASPDGELPGVGGTGVGVGIAAPDTVNDTSRQTESPFRSTAHTVKR
ncbi:MAG: hypothetical protein AAB037_02020 [Chloroflexota bacterium]